MWAGSRTLAEKTRHSRARLSIVRKTVQIYSSVRYCEKPSFQDGKIQVLVGKSSKDNSSEGQLVLIVSLDVAPGIITAGPYHHIEGRCPVNEWDA